MGGELGKQRGGNRRAVGTRFFFSAAAIFFKTSRFLSSLQNKPLKNSLGLFSKSEALLYSFTLSPAESMTEPNDEGGRLVQFQGVGGGRGGSEGKPPAVRHRDHAPLPPRSNPISTYL